MDCNSERSKKSVHDHLGGGILADLMLWRKRNVSIGILVGTAIAWILFEQSGYTLLSFFSNIVLLLATILFIWATTAAIVGRPAPPLPEVEVTDEMTMYTATLIQNKINFLFKVTHDIALGKNPILFFKVAAWLWVISTVGSLCDFITLAYACLAISLTIPALYERYEEKIDYYTSIVFSKAKHVYSRFDTGALKALVMKLRKIKKVQ